MTDSKTYTPPRVWQWEQETESRFANINRPIAGATHEKVTSSWRASVAALLAGDT